ncbi:MAG: phosphate starvation-inducible protein PhoH [Dehalococcoidia bacterium]|nr:phosphate starvation-inducible protein PhoH [Dehalococcoidia bacterium]
MQDDLITEAVQPRRTYILDTNVLLHDPNALTVFDEHDVVVPITVIEELDRFKKDLNEIGRNARWVSRRLDELRRAGEGSLSSGILNAGGGRVRVVMPTGCVSLPSGFGKDSNDNAILRTVLEIARQKSPDPVIFVSRDTNMRIKADALRIPAEDYEHGHIEVDEVYKGIIEMDESGERIDQLYAHGALQLTAEQRERLSPNAFIVLRNPETPGHAALARFDAWKNHLRLVGKRKDAPWGVSARNKEQIFALDLLLDDRVKIVTLNGVAGTGKTLLALAAGLQRAVEEGHYRRLLVSRPIFPLGRDLGFLPGDISEKLNPWMKPIFDNLEFLFGADEEKDAQRRGGQPKYQYLLERGLLQVEPLTYIRGRSLPHQYMLVDEAQNLTPHEVKTVVSRAGEGTKIILTGDPYQIDNPYVDATSNGLSHVIERFKSSPLAGHITLTKGERSELAELATRVL